MSTVSLPCLPSPGRSDVSAIRIYDIGSGHPSNIASFRIDYSLLWQRLRLPPSRVALKGMWVKEHHNQVGTQVRLPKSMLLPHRNILDHFYLSAQPVLGA